MNKTRTSILICICLLASIITPTYASNDRRSDIKLEYASETIPLLPKGIEAGIKEALKDTAEHYQFVIGSSRIIDDEALITLVIIDKDAPKSEHGNGEDVKIFAHRESDETWGVYLEQDKDFALAVNASTSGLLSQEGKELFTQAENLESDYGRMLTGVGYKFPWVNGLSFYYNGSWHWGYGNALDVGTTGSERRTLASTSGTITTLVTCTDTSRMEIADSYGNTLGYVHIDTATLPGNIFQGANVVQGQVLGELELGSFNDGDTCGYSPQNESSAHLHWILPYSINVENWTISHANSYWLDPNGNPVYTSYNLVLPSTNVPNYGSNCGGANVVVQGLSINSGQTFNCNATNSITVSPETSFLSGSTVNLSI